MAVSSTEATRVNHPQKDKGQGVLAPLGPVKSLFCDGAVSYGPLLQPASFLPPTLSRHSLINCGDI